jgi:hypothetical protein
MTIYRTCWNNLATRLIQYQQGCYKLRTACSKFVDNLGQAVRTQLVDGLLADLLQTTCEILTRVKRQILYCIGCIVVLI